MERVVHVGELPGMEVIIDKDERELGNMHRLILKLSQHEVGPGPSQHRRERDLKYDLDYSEVCCNKHTKSYFNVADWKPVMDCVMTRDEFSSLVFELNAPLIDIYPPYFVWNMSYFCCLCCCVMDPPLKQAVQRLKDVVAELNKKWDPRGMRLYVKDLSVALHARVVGEIILEFYTRSLYDAPPRAIMNDGGDAPDLVTLKECDFIQ